MINFVLFTILFSVLWIGVYLLVRSRNSYLSALKALEKENLSLKNEIVQLEDNIKNEDLYNRSYLLSLLEISLDEKIILINLNSSDVFTTKSLLKELKIVRKGINKLDDFLDLIQVDYKIFLQKKFDLLISDGTSFDTEVQFYPKFSSKFKYNINVRVIQLNGQKVLKIRLYDTEEIKRLKDQLDHQVRMLDEILGSTPDQFLRFDNNGKCIFANVKAMRDLGYSNDTLVGQHISELEFFENFHGKLLRQIQSVIATGHSLKGNLQILTMDGLMQYEYDLVPNYDVSRNLHSVLATFRDITLQKEYERQLMDAQTRAIKSAKVKSEFLANMSHEIRTPLNSIIGIADLLLESELTRDQRNYVNIFQGACSTLLQLVNDILDFSKIEAGQMKFESIECNIEELVFESFHLVSRTASEKGLPVLVNISHDCPREFIGDPTRIKQIIFNLVSNAIKFTNDGHILILVDYSKSEHKYKISVKDTGIGISKEKISTIFSNFSQADTTISRLYGGTGLGLSISSKLVQLMGGSLGVKSVEGEGSEFYFDMFVELNQANEKQHVKYKTSQNIVILESIDIHFNYLRSLFIDNIEINRFNDLNQLKSYITERPTFIDHLIVTNHSVKNDLDEFKKLLSNNVKVNNCIYLVDQFTKPELSKYFGADSAVKLINLPFNKERLFEVLDNSEAVHIEEEFKKETYSIASDKKFKILLVDDSEANLNLLSLFLKKVNCEIALATNGQEALEAFDKDEYDLIFMDIQMPILDGYQATENIRKKEKENRVGPTPIIALTANVMQENVNQCYLAGCDYYLSKPVRKEVFLKTISNILDGNMPEKESA